MANIRRSRRSGFTLRGGKNVRESLWFSWQESANNLPSANSAVLTNLLNAAALALTPFTVIRFRGNLHVASDQSAALETYSMALGMAVVSVQASAIGVTAIPTPAIDVGSDLWFVYERVTSKFDFVSGVGFHPAAGVIKEIDSRAMRKVQEGEDIVSVIENGALTAAGCDVRFSGRILIKLH